VNISWTVLAVVLLVAWRMPLLGGRWLSAVEDIGTRFAARKGLAIVAVVLAVIFVRVALLWTLPVPAPLVMDEFSYLLAGDTFAHGRLANPPHPMRPFLDTMHVLSWPTYASMYPPAQGAVLALGERLGHPWIGVLLSMGAMFGAVLWMMQGWLPAKWALLGVSILWLRIGPFNYWMNSYWGGAVAAFGGALVMGALPRILRRPRVSHSLLLALGLAIMVNSRPLEGFLISVPVAIVFLLWLVRDPHPSWRVIVCRVIVPLSAVFILTAAFTLYYNWRVTGDPLLFPHVLSIRTRSPVTDPYFVFSKPKPPLRFSNHQFDVYYNEYMLSTYPFTWRAYLSQNVWGKLVRFKNFFLGPALIVPFIGLPWALRDRRIRLLVTQIVLVALVSFTLLWFHPHYFAPMLGSFLVVLTQMLRHLRRWKFRGQPVGVGLTRAVLLTTAISVPTCLGHAVKHPRAAECRGWGWPGNWDRVQATKELEATPGEHLVIVRYSAKHTIDLEWVQNAADVDHAKIVWAREIPGIDLWPLLDYYKGRKVWVVEPDVSPPRLRPFFAAAPSNVSAPNHNLQPARISNPFTP
jgi:hypothetical protein